jgi:NAD(P)-dependent dehydrogenase (short-subunit alcohol dehydrogenase family)
MWTAEAMPDLSGKTVIITGANSGIGWEAALQFARKGAQTILACRSMERGNDAMRRILDLVPKASVEARQLDLASLASIRAFANEFCRRGQPLHVLCNNAGVVGTPYQLTADGFELQFGTNHLGHFALTGLLLARLLAAPSARVVTVASFSHWLSGPIRFDDINWKNETYSKWMAYAQSKRLNLLFAFELQRRAERSATNLASIGTHPGFTATDMLTTSARLNQSASQMWSARLSNRLIAQSASTGALTTLYAATAPEIRGGDFVGPRWFMWGHPVRARCSAEVRDESIAARLWELSENLTGVRYLFRPAR